jgi:hypothetical protein
LLSLGFGRGLAQFRYYLFHIGNSTAPSSQSGSLNNIPTKRLVVP